MAYKMKGPSLYKDSPVKQKPHPAGTGVGHLGKGFNIKGYLKGEQGLIPDYKGQSTKKTVKKVVKRVKKAANKSTFTNPKGLSEHMSDQMDAKMHTSYLTRLKPQRQRKRRKVIQCISIIVKNQKRTDLIKKIDIKINGKRIKRRQWLQSKY